MIGLLHTCSISRLTALGNNRKTFPDTPQQPSVSCLFLPMSAYASVQNGFDVESGWNVYFDDGTDVQVNDRLTYDSTTYLVRGVKAFKGIPAVSHMEIAAVTENSHV